MIDADEIDCKDEGCPPSHIKRTDTSHSAHANHDDAMIGSAANPTTTMAVADEGGAATMRIIMPPAAPKAVGSSSRSLPHHCGSEESRS